MKGATRAEVLADLIAVIKTDYNQVISKRDITCPDCNGVGFHVEGEDDKVGNCATCANTGKVTVEHYDPEAVPDDLRPYVTGFKVGPRGTLLPDMRSKDKAAAELIKAISNGWCNTFQRDAYGGDASDPLSKDSIIASYAQIAAGSDPTTAMAALREISKLKGYLTPDDEAADNKALNTSDVQGFFNALLTSRGHQLPNGPRATDGVHPAEAELLSEGEHGESGEAG